MFNYLAKISAGQDELIWAQVFHDTLRGQGSLEKMSVSPGRWAGGYSFLYVLLRILIDYRPSSVLELGLGESTKLISGFYADSKNKCVHHVIEHDISWLNHFKSKNEIAAEIDFALCEMVLQKKGNSSYYSYKDFASKILPKYDLYVVDGPLGSDHFSRYDILKATDQLEKGDEFIILLDDYNRAGEAQTARDLIKSFRDRNIEVHTNIYYGIKYQIVIATEKYKWACSF